MNASGRPGRVLRASWMIGVALVVLTIGPRPGASAASRPRGNNVCTKVKRFTEVYRVPLPGSRTQKISYTTICGIQGRCSRYRIVYVPNYREETRSVYRVVQECCTGWVQSGRRCVVRASTDAAAGTKTTPDPTAYTVAGGTGATAGPGRPSLTGPSGPAGRGPGGEAGGANGGRGIDGIQGRGGAGKGTGSGGKGGRGGGGVGVAGVEPGVTGPGVTGEGVLQDGGGGVLPEGGAGTATPDVQPPEEDSGRMMFLTGMLCGVGVLSAAAFVVLFLMYRQRRSLDGGVVGMPFLQSSRFASTGSFRKSKLLALAQSIKSGEVKLIRESTKKEKNNAQGPPYTDIVEMQRVITLDKTANPLPALSPKRSDPEPPGLKLSQATTTMTLQRPTGPNERQLPPEPPNYAIIQRMDTTESEDGFCSEASTPRCSAEFRYSTLYATPDAAAAVAGGSSHTVPRDFNLGPPRYILCESQHIYTDIHRKSKASTWSCSKKSRSKSTASAGDAPRRSLAARRSLRRSRSRTSLQSPAKRASHSASSGYSSLHGSRENVYDNYERVAEERERADRPSSNIYSETIPKEPLGGAGEHYDRLELIASDSWKTEYDKLTRGPKTSRGAGFVKTFSKKYDKLAAGLSRR